MFTVYQVNILNGNKCLINAKITIILYLLLFRYYTFTNNYQYFYFYLESEHSELHLTIFLSCVNYSTI